MAATTLPQESPSYTFSIRARAGLQILAHAMQYLGGCGHGGTWPCGTTRAAWLARGLDPDQEVRRIVQAVRQAAGPDLDEIADDEDVLC